MTPTMLKRQRTCVVANRTKTQKATKSRKQKNYEKDGREKMVQLAKETQKGQKAEREQIVWPSDGKSQHWARESLKSGNESVHSFFFARCGERTRGEQSQIPH